MAFRQTVSINDRGRRGKRETGLPAGHLRRHIESDVQLRTADSSCLAALARRNDKIMGLVTSGERFCKLTGRALPKPLGVHQRFARVLKRISALRESDSRKAGTGWSDGCFPRCVGLRAGRAVCGVVIEAQFCAPGALQLQLRYLTGKKLRVSILREGKKSFAKFSTRRKILC
jgi:hypothetical protein